MDCERVVAVDLVVESLSSPDQISDHKARIGSLGSVLGFGNNASLLLPSTGFIFEPFKESDFLDAFSMFAFGPPPQLGAQSLEPLVLGDTYDVMNLVRLTPT
jgi:hypothetical protein